MEAKLIDWTKPIETSKGQPARFLANLDGQGMNAYVVAVNFGAGEVARSVDACGHGWEVELRNVRKPFRFERWVNVYEGGFGVMHVNKEDALENRARIACVKVIIEGHEGDGLDAVP